MAEISAPDLLLEWCRFGWRYRNLSSRPHEQQAWYADRIKYETSLIIDREFSDYFLMVSDAIRWGKDNGIAFGPGRGSVAASVASWMLRITEIDPYRYPGMLFERFLDVSRPDPPDIDVDCSDERRDEVRAYLASKYGDECIGQIANFVRYRGKNSLADVAKVYSVPISSKEIVSNLLIERSGGDARFNATLEDTVEMFPAARDVFDQFPDLWKATRLEGNVRGMGKHAAGILISGSPLTDICAVYERDGIRVLSIDKYDAEYAGALKLDFLGLSTMGMVSRCLEMADLTLEDLYAIPDTDEETLNVFRSGDVTGIFQFEGRAQRLVNRDVSPDNFQHLADINALARPGPLLSGITAEYVDVRHGRRKATRFHPVVDDITKTTYGQIVYQEQILNILKEIGGFDWFSVSQIRRIISKKLGEAAFQMSYDKFAEGAERLHGIKRETANQIWRRIVTSGVYSFNIAHAISYSMLGFWTAWLKCHYPLQFYAASLAKSSDEDSQFRLMKDALSHGISINNPSIERSKRTWSIAGTGLVAGWEQIPGIGEKTAERIENDLAETPAIWWQDLQRIPGIGPVTCDKMMAFANAKDPFGLYRTEKIMSGVLAWIKTQNLVPAPTHNGDKLASILMKDNPDGTRRFTKGPRVVYAGIARSLNMQDVIENRRSRSGEDVEDILKTLKRPDLLEFCSLRCYDTTDEEVYVRVNRYVFPKLKKKIQSISLNHDVLIVIGNRIAGFGTPVMAQNIYVIDPED